MSEMTSETKETQTDRLRRQMEFIVEMDRLKRVYRQTMVMDKSRYENDAEHSWHLAMMALLLNEHAKEPVDVLPRPENGLDARYCRD